MEEFRFGYGAAWLDLLATKRMRRRPPEVEYLSDAAALRRWLAAAGLAPTEDPNAGDVDAAIDLREALYVLARAAVDPPTSGADGLDAHRDRCADAINRALAADRAPGVRAGPDGLRIAAPPTAPVAVAWIARQAVADLTGPVRERLRACGDATCGGIFVDVSGRQRWCSDRTCGSRARVRAHRARVRSQPTTRSPA